MKDNIDRRGFLKKICGSASLAGLTAIGCSPAKEKTDTRTDTGLGEMTYRENHTNGDKVSLLGYGCMRWPLTKNADGIEVIDQERVNDLVDYAISRGVNYFDTAPVYVQGQSEKATAAALSRHPRKSYFIATKLSNFSNWTKENSLKLYYASFENLNTEYIDYYLLHAVGGGGVTHFKERFVENGMLDFLINERKEGRIRNLGFSFHGDKACFDYVLSLHSEVHWDFVQIQLNYMDWKHASKGNLNAEYLYGELQKRNIQAIVMEPLLGGRLAKVPDHIAIRLKERNPQGSVASWAFRFAGTHPGILTVLSGMTYMEHLQDNIRTYSPLHPLNESDFSFLEETATLMLKYPTVPCNDCKYCMPCPYGIDIPAILLHYNKCVNEGLAGISSDDSEYKKARRAYLIGYDRAVEKTRQADHCIGCRKCTSHCPQKINIPRELQRISMYIERLKRNPPDSGTDFEAK